MGSIAISGTSPVVDDARPLRALQDEPKAHVRVNALGWVSMPFKGFQNMYSGMWLACRAGRNVKWFARVAFIGQCQLRGAAVYLFVEPETEKLFFMSTARRAEEHAWFTVPNFPLTVAELELGVNLAQKIAATTLLVGASKGLGFQAPFPQFKDKGMVPLTELALMRLVKWGGSTVFIRRPGTTDMIPLLLADTNNQFDLLVGLRTRSFADDPATDGLLARFQPARNTWSRVQVTISARELSDLLVVHAVYVQVEPAEKHVPRTPAATSIIAHPQYTDLQCVHLKWLPSVCIVWIRTGKENGWGFEGRLIGVLPTDSSSTMLVFEIDGKLYSVECNDSLRVNASAHVSEAAFYVSTTFAVQDQYPDAFVFTDIKEQSADAKQFHKFVRDNACIKDAWRQSEGTCWANTILNVITLTPSMRAVFMDATIDDVRWDPVSRAARAIQNAVKCKSTEDTPFCAFPGPEMVCKLLRIGFTTGGNTVLEFRKLCAAANIPIGDGITHLDCRFQLVHACALLPGVNISKTPEKWSYERHAVAAFIMLYGTDAHGTDAHAMAGIKCSSKSPLTPAKYMIIDDTRTYNFDWLEAAQGTIYWHKEFINIFNMFGDFYVDLVDIYVLLDTHVAFAEPEVEVLDIED